MSLPGELDEAPSMSVQLKPQLPITDHRADEVTRKDLNHQLLGRLDVPHHLILRPIRASALIVPRCRGNADHATSCTRERRSGRRLNPITAVPIANSTPET